MEYATNPQNPLEVILPNTTFWGWVGQEEWPIDIGGNTINYNALTVKKKFQESVNCQPFQKSQNKK